MPINPTTIITPTPAQSPAPTTPLRQVSLTADDLQNPGLLNETLNNYGQMINYLLGHSGPVRINSSYDFSGNPVRNVGAPTDPADVVSQIYADKYYGAQALVPQFEALGKSVLQTYRQLNNPIQVERYSSFLNGVLNTAPTANTSLITASSPSGGSVSITITSGIHQRVDHSSVPYTAYNDTLLIPASYALTSLSRINGIVTAVTSSSNPLVVGEGFTVYNSADASFWGSFVVIGVASPTQFTYSQIGQPNASTTGGSISLNNVYYYTISAGQNTLTRVQSGSGVDSWSERTTASYDGNTIVAVAVINFQGLDLYNSAAGATPPVSGANIPVVRRM